MGKKSINARTNAILAELGEIKKRHPVETTARDEAVKTIDALHPTDSEYPTANEVGEGLLEEARRLVGNRRTWRDETTAVLIKYAELCEQHHRTGSI